MARKKYFMCCSLIFRKMLYPICGIRCKALSFFSVPLILCLVAQSAFCDNITAFVDIEKILIQSNAAHLGREHIKSVRSRLEQGYNELANTLAKHPEQQRQKDMQEAAQALNQQLELEKAAVNHVITQMMMEEIRTYRIANKIGIVVPKQVILDADAGLDITNQIIKAMNTKQPKFGQLPVVQVKKQPQINSAKKK